ncbi:unnamed protein product [Mytilus edulis]|uniref:SAM domain-containing protein n=1 Tax=Mytilus edulis TaxID=6550 RepID=A0A8S3S2C0_MYTED|nr:unnamed protein product [Mytilus edulis]
MDISVSEFLQQLGPEFMKYKQTFMENEFCDSSSLRAMNIEVDLDYMFETNPLPLGHKRKLQYALKNLESVTCAEKNEVYIAPPESSCTEKNMDKIKEKLESNLQLKEKEKQDYVHKRRQMDLIISDPDPIGPLKSTRCGNCHMRGHKADGNRGNKPCTLPPCNSWKDCGQKDKHTDYKVQCKQFDKDIKNADKEIEEMSGEIARLTSFQEKANSSFIGVIKERLRQTNKKKYINSNVLMRDVIYLKDFFNNEIPNHPQSLDEEEFSQILNDRAKKTLARYQIKKNIIYEDISDEEPPQKIQKVVTSKPETPLIAPQATKVQQMDYSNLFMQNPLQNSYQNPYQNPYGMYAAGYYGYNPYMLYQQGLQQNVEVKPPLPLGPPPDSE